MARYISVFLMNYSSSVSESNQPGSRSSLAYSVYRAAHNLAAHNPAAHNLAAHNLAMPTSTLLPPKRSSFEIFPHKYFVTVTVTVTQKLRREPRRRRLCGQLDYQRATYEMMVLQYCQRGVKEVKIFCWSFLLFDSLTEPQRERSRMMLPRGYTSCHTSISHQP